MDQNETAYHPELLKKYPFCALLVDDNSITQLLLEKILLHLGFKTVDIASNGNEAIGRIIRNKYDIIFMDVMMPEMGGLQTSRILRSKYNLEIPIIALTAKKIKNDVEKCFEAGMTHHVAKPFTWEIIHKVVEKYLGDKQGQLEKSSSQKL